MNYIDDLEHSSNISIEQENTQYSKSEEKLSINVELSNSMLLLLKMSLVYSAIMDGWRVEKLSNSKFCFTKKNIFKEISVKSFFKQHLNKQLFSK